MSAPINQFKQAIKGLSPEGKRAQIGLWLGLANSYTSQLCAGAGFDWLLIDAEHAPNDLQTLVGQLQSMQGYPVTPIIRPAWPDAVRIKQILDVGTQTVLAPMVESGQQAAEVVAATRYPPEGIRGVGSALARASEFNRTPAYLKTANDQMCVLIQIETPAGVAALDDILAVEGVDGVFIGPSDLSASMGHIGNPAHPDVQAVIEESIAKIVAAGKAPGILIADKGLAKRYIELGAKFVGVGSDTALLMKATTDLAAEFKDSVEAIKQEKGSVY
ncbi:MAG: 4-hydroxy-2-oxoheptanedioate aldolase [Oceanobacter sp.]